MRTLPALALALAAGIAAGCGGAEHPDPTVKAFTGKLVAGGKPVTFPDGDKVSLQLIYKKRAETFGIPIKPDGSFQIGWMPIGEYSAVLHHLKTAAKAGQANTPIPAGLTIEDGKTDYTVDLGAKYKP